MTKLSELEGRFGAQLADYTPETGGRQTGNWQIIFRCPVCRTHTMSVHVGPRGSGLHEATPLPPDANWMDHLTVTPSIDNTRNSYRGNPCGFHGFITNGEVTTS